MTVLQATNFDRLFALKTFRKGARVFVLSMFHCVNTLICTFKLVCYVITNWAYKFRVIKNALEKCSKCFQCLYC